VTAVAYLPALPDGNVRSFNEVYSGAVLPHPEFKFLRDEQGQVESTHADLALILLKEPTTPNFPPIELADIAAPEREFLTLVGYGDDELSDGHGEGRRFSKHQVLKLPAAEGDLMVLDAPSRPTHQDDSGGPCLNEASGVPLLAGISRRGLGRESTCTSTLIHKDWLHEQLRRASRPDSSNP
jgi:hypothetical protein